MEERPSGSTGCALVGLSVLLFKAVHGVLGALPVPAAVAARQDAFRLFRYRNLVVSLTHAAASGAWAAVVFAVYWKELWSDLLRFCNWPTYGLVCFSSGYFLYDTLDILLAGRMREKWDILIHHAAILGSASYTVTAVDCIGYHSLAMLIEINTVFLHTRKLLQIGGVAGSSPYIRINRWLNLSTFLIFRFLPLGTLGKALILEPLPPLFFAFFSLALPALLIVNAVLFWRLLRADLECLRVKGKGHAKTDSMVGLCASLRLLEDNVASYADLGPAPPTLLSLSSNGIASSTVNKRKREL